MCVIHLLNLLKARQKEDLALTFSEEITRGSIQSQEVICNPLQNAKRPHAIEGVADSGTDEFSQLSF